MGKEKIAVTAHSKRTVAKLANSLPTTRNTNKHHTTINPKPITPPNNILLDSACTDTCIRISDVPAQTLISAAPSTLSLRTARADAEITATAQLPITVAGLQSTAHLFIDKHLDANLLSISDLTNAPNFAEVRFHANGVGVYKTSSTEGEQLAFYPKQPDDKLWSTSLPTESAPASAMTAIKSESAYDFVMLNHAICGSPCASTFYRAIRKGWINIKNLTAKSVYRNWPNSLATAQGHLQQTRQGIRSTSKLPRKREKPVTATSPDYILSEENSDEELHIRTFRRTDAAFADATGRYPTISLEGFEYLLVFVYKNYIHVEPLPDRTSTSYVTAYTAAFTFFDSRGHKINNIVLDNETSAALTNYFASMNIAYQNVSPGNKRANRAERAIQTWRHHMVATLGTVNGKCPKQLWSYFIGQMEICLNFLRPFESDNTMSAYEGIFRAKYDHDAHPLSICGCAVLVFEPPASRPTWSTHGVQGFYLGPNGHSYRSWIFYITPTNSIRASDTAQFFPEPFKLPGASYEEQMIAAIDKLISIANADNAEALAPAVAAVTEIRNNMDGNIQIIAPNQPDGALCPPPQPAALVPPDEPVIAPVIEPLPVPVITQRVPKVPRKQRVPISEPEPAAVTKNPLEDRRPRSHKRVPIDSLREPTPAERETATFKEFAKKIHHRFVDTDTDETFQIERVMMPIKPRGKGSNTHHYVFTNMNESHLQRRKRQEEFTRCAELLNAKYVKWLPLHKKAAYAILSKEPYDGRPLNQRSDGKKFSFRSESEGPRGGYWKLADREEYMRLFDSNTLLPEHRRNIPSGETITYYNRQAKEKLPKDLVEYRVRGTYGGNRSNYTGPVSNNTAEYPVVKILLNATLSDRIHKDKDTKFATADMVDFYLGTDLDQPGYMTISADDIGDELIDLYNLREYIVTTAKGRIIYFKVVKCLYGHPASGRLSFLKLKGILEEGGFYEDLEVDCLFKHRTRNIMFTLIVDDMGIKYAKQEDLDYLVSIIEPHWKLKVDLTGSKFIGMHLAWQYDRPVPRVIIYNPTVVRDALARFAPGKKMRGASTPSPYTQPVYGKRTQTGPFDEFSPAPPETIKFVQEVTGLFNHYSRVIDYTMAEAVTSIARTQAAPTTDTIKRVNHLLNYAASHPCNCIIYEASDMILAAQSDASFQSIPGSRSKAGGTYYFANKGDPPTKNNGLIGVYSRIISVVCGAASDAEYAALFAIAQLVYFYRIVAEACGYPQSEPSPIYVDNDVARGIANRSVKVKRSKSIDKSFHYIRDRVELGDIAVLRVGTDDNISDFFTKALPPQRHKDLSARINQRLPAHLQ